jgi:hypothetical protein
MMTQTSLSADSQATPASPEKCASNFSFESPASSLQNLIANLELEFRSTHRKLSPLRISNRKYLAIFHPNSQARSRATSPNFQNGNSFCSTPIVYPELRRAAPHPRNCFESFVQFLRATDRGSRATEFLIANARLEFHSTRRKLSSLKIANRERIAISQFAPRPLRRPASPSLRSEASVNPTPIVYPEFRRAPFHPHMPLTPCCVRIRRLSLTTCHSPLVTDMNAKIAAPVQARADVPQDTRLFLHLDLIRIAGHDLRDFQVARDFAGHAQVFIAIQVFRPAEFRTVTPPDDQRKDLIRILFVKVDKCRLAFAARDEMNAHHSPAHGRLFSYVIFRFSRGDALRLRQRRGGCQQQECDKNRGSELSQRFAFQIPISATSRRDSRRDLAHCKFLNRQSKRQTLGWCGKRSNKGFRYVRPSSAVLIYGTAIRNPRKGLKT